MKRKGDGNLWGIAKGWWLALGLTAAGCGAGVPDGSEGNAGGGGNSAGGHGGIEAVVQENRERAIAGSFEEAFVVAPSVAATTCTSNSQCSTGFCVDGYCCDTSCDYKCMACSAAKKGSGADGVCGSIKYDTDPDNDCPYGACDGKNACKNYNGFACASTAQCLSNYCVDGVCCGNICMGVCQACSAAKKGSGSDGICGTIKAATDPDNECTDSECNGSGACTTSPQPTSANGTACTSAAQCASGFCADGVCCDSWCLGTCQACTAAKKMSGVDGVCGPIANDKDPDEECWGGACNGAGVCKQYNGIPCSDKSQCLSNYCVDGFCCGNICTQWCHGCSNAKKGQGYDGVCGPIISGRDVDNECSPGECNGSGACNQAQTPLANGTACLVAAQCASGNCVDGYCCDTACTETCKACSAAKKGSGANGACGNIASETDPDSECGYGGKCGGNGTCRYYNGVSCTSGSQCFSNYCVDGVCCGNVCTGTCYACSAAKKGQGSDGSCGPIASTRDPDNECNPGECNGSGACNQSQTPQPNGATCASATQCASGFCVEGICCDTACTGLCQACSAAKKGSGTNGTCGPIKYDTDPDEECYGGACSGSGACEQYNGLSCTAATHCLSHYCVDGVCCGNVCAGTCMACTAAKKGSGYDGVCGPIAQWSNPDSECPGGTCNGSGACAALLGNGNACTANVQCASGFCVDGVCCDTTCSATCVACNLAGTVGTCTAEPAGVCSVCTKGIGLPGAPAEMLSAGQSWLVDLNGDGFPDHTGLPSSGYVAPDVYVYPKAMRIRMNNGDGTYGDEISYTVPAGPHVMEFADFNADGSTDIAVTNVHGVMNPNNEYVQGMLSILMNNGNGTFAASVDFESNDWVFKMVAADFTGDGLPDLATGAWNTAHIWRNNGNGTFTRIATKSGPQGPNAIVAADLNGDGSKDLAITGDYSSSVRVWFNQGTGTLSDSVDYSIFYRGTTLTAADLNGDGNLDLTATHSSANDGASILLNNGNGTFASYVRYSQGQRLGDVNGDGKPDLVGAHDSTDLLSVRLNQGNGTFGVLVQYPTGDGPTLLPPRDVNGDGKIDLVTANANSRTVSVFINQGTGTFGPKVDYRGAVGSSLSTIEDLNGDGLVDLVLMNGGNFQPVLNVGNGAFGPDWADYQTGAGPMGIAAADLNADGLPDVATSNNSGNTVSILLNQGNGTLGAHIDYPAANGPYSIVAADVNADGAPDLAVSNDLSGTVSVFVNQSNGTFASKVDYPVGTTPRRMAAADLNGDGRIDLAVVNYDSGTMSVLFNQGNGTFASKVDYAVGDTPSGVAAADFNGDGFIDLAVALRTPSTVGLLLNQGNGTFAPKVDVATGSRCLFVQAADMNGDGKQDLLVGNEAMYEIGTVMNLGNGAFGPMLRWYMTGYSQGGGAVAADLNGDSALDLAVAGNDLPVRLNQGNGMLKLPYYYPLTSSYLTSIAAADFDGDSRPDLVTASPLGYLSMRLSRCLP